MCGEWEQYTGFIYFNAIMKICWNMCSEPYFAKSALYCHSEICCYPITITVLLEFQYSSVQEILGMSQFN